MNWFYRKRDYFASNKYITTVDIDLIRNPLDKVSRHWTSIILKQDPKSMIPDDLFLTLIQFSYFLSKILVIAPASCFSRWALTGSWFSFTGAFNISKILKNRWKTKFPVMKLIISSLNMVSKKAHATEFTFLAHFWTSERRDFPFFLIDLTN